MSTEEAPNVSKRVRIKCQHVYQRGDPGRSCPNYASKGDTLCAKHNYLLKQEKWAPRATTSSGLDKGKDDDNMSLISIQESEASSIRSLSSDSKIDLESYIYDTIDKYMARIDRNGNTHRKKEDSGMNLTTILLMSGIPLLMKYFISDGKIDLSNILSSLSSPNAVPKQQGSNPACDKGGLHEGTKFVTDNAKKQSPCEASSSVQGKDGCHPVAVQKSITAMC